MPAPAVTLKLRRFRRHFGIAAPRVAVRRHFGWHWYVVGLGFLAVVVAVIVWSLAQQGEAAQLNLEIEALRRRMTDMDAEMATLRANAGTAQSSVQMERAAQERLLGRIKSLELENAALKEDLSIFERLVPADGDQLALRIERFLVVPGLAPGSYRYRLLIGYQPSKQVREFRGRLQLQVLYVVGGKEQQLVVPARNARESESLVEVKNFLRKEGEFHLPQGARLKTVEAAIFQGDTLKAKRLAQP